MTSVRQGGLYDPGASMLFVRISKTEYAAVVYDPVENCLEVEMSAAVGNDDYVYLTTSGKAVFSFSLYREDVFEATVDLIAKAVKPQFFNFYQPGQIPSFFFPRLWKIRRIWHGIKA